MLIYEKWITENDEKVRHLFGTLENIPSESDNQLVYKDADGDVLSDLVLPTSTIKYIDNGSGGILQVDATDPEAVVTTFIGVNIKKSDNSLVNIIPGHGYIPATKTLKSIRFKKKPTKVEYAADATEVDPTGAIIEATWETGEKSVVANADVIFTFKDTLVADVANAIVASYTYPETGTTVIKTAECAITVVAAG